MDINLNESNKDEEKSDDTCTYIEVIGENLCRLCGHVVEGRLVRKDEK